MVSEVRSAPISLQDLLVQTGQQDRPGEKFQLENPYTLEVNVDSMIWTKLGSMVAYRGNLKFEREGMLEGGLMKALKSAMTGEKAPLMKVTGRGVVYLAEEKKHIMLVRLNNETINVSGNDLLAFEDTLSWDIKMIKRIAGMLAGGLFCVQLSGSGVIAISTHGIPLALRASASDPICTDPNATVAWSGNLSPNLKTDMSFRTFIGRGSGESFQMQFAGDGFVIVQPCEEVAMAQTS